MSSGSQRDSALATRVHYGWAGTVKTFLGVSLQEWLNSLVEHHHALHGMSPSGSQVDAWRDEYAVMQASLSEVISDRSQSGSWGLAFEYELPFEGGRRPDAVLLAGATVLVLEFKREAMLPLGYFDQTAAYARDIGEYHAASHGHDVSAVLVCTADRIQTAAHHSGASLATREHLGQQLLSVPDDKQIELSEWLDASYAPLPSLVSAARRIFQHEPLPHVRRALSARIPETVELVAGLADDAEANGRRRLILITGVPGAGKTLVGLRLVYERSDDSSTRATFLSGNGPLVSVLQDALKSRAFVRDLHRFITSYGETARIPKEHVLVFDEAQRAWDRDYMLTKRGVAKSEPELLVSIGERLPSWAALVGLVGGGQEIYSGEESGLAQWRDAIASSPEAQSWDIHAPPAIADYFHGLPLTVHEDLELTVSLRSRLAEQLHDWVASLLDGDLARAADLAHSVQDEQFPLYVTRDLDDARAYARARYDGHEDARYGLVASSQAKVLPRFGVENGWIATSRMKVARWYNEGSEHPESCCALTQPVTEFGCQGLELDLPIVCWGEDMRWTGSSWQLRPVRRRYPQKDPHELLRNAYRVLLTRGRDGVVIFVPDDGELDATFDALVRAGVRAWDIGPIQAARGDRAVVIDTSS